MWYTCISGYRKRTPHFRLLPMVKCPLDCFLVYSFLLDVEQAKIRHAPFGTFAFSDKPLRNPSEHSDFWYIQGRIFSSCGLSETQGLPRSLVRFRAHRGDRSRKAHKWLYFPLQAYPCGFLFPAPVRHPTQLSTTYRQFGVKVV